MTTVYLVRHCETLGNKQGVFQGRIDMDISDAGREQLAQLERRFAVCPLDAVYSSPLLRAKRTAMAIMGSKPLPLQLDERLIEIDGGCWESKSWSELPTFDPEQSRRWVEEPHLFGPQGGEPMRRVFDRMSAALTDLAAQNDDKTIAVVSHGCSIRNALCWAKGLPIEKLKTVLWCDNTGVCIFEIDSDGVTVVAENDHSHLQKQASPKEQNAWWRG